MSRADEADHRLIFHYGAMENVPARHLTPLSSPLNRDTQNNVSLTVGRRARVREDRHREGG